MKWRTGGEKIQWLTVRFWSSVDGIWIFPNRRWNSSSSCKRLKEQRWRLERKTFTSTSRLRSSSESHVEVGWRRLNFVRSSPIVVFPCTSRWKKERSSIFSSFLPTESLKPRAMALHARLARVFQRVWSANLLGWSRVAIVRDFRADSVAIGKVSVDWGWYGEEVGTYWPSVGTIVPLVEPPMRKCPDEKRHSSTLVKSRKSHIFSAVRPLWKERRMGVLPKGIGLAHSSCVASIKLVLSTANSWSPGSRRPSCLATPFSTTSRT